MPPMRNMAADQVIANWNAKRCHALPDPSGPLGLGYRCNDCMKEPSRARFRGLQSRCATAGTSASRGLRIHPPEAYSSEKDTLAESGRCFVSFLCCMC